MTRSAPQASGCCHSGPRNVLSMITSGRRPSGPTYFAATAAHSAMSTRSLVGLAGVSTKMSPTRPRAAAFSIACSSDGEPA